MPKQTLREWWHDHFKLTIAFSGVVTAIAGGIIAVESRYAHADDVKKVLSNQQEQINLYKQHQTENQLFQLEYYNSRIQRLEDEKRKSQVIHSDSKTPPTVKIVTRGVDDIDAEIKETKNRKDFVEKSMTFRSRSIIHK